MKNAEKRRKNPELALKIFLLSACSILHSRHPPRADTKLANSRYAPGPPAGNCLNHAYDVYTNTPLPYLAYSSPPGFDASPGSFDAIKVSYRGSQSFVKYSPRSCTHPFQSSGRILFGVLS